MAVCIITFILQAAMELPIYEYVQTLHALVGRVALHGTRVLARIVGFDMACRTCATCRRVPLPLPQVCHELCSGSL